MPAEVRIRSEALAAISNYAHSDATRECCGLLGGRDGAITRAFPGTNVASNSATSYEITPKELFRLMREIRAANLRLLGIYHSHPTGENAPSPRDIAEACYPDAIYFIISPRKDAKQPVRAFSIRGSRAAELDVNIV
ncbi:MAG: M67 family metallopeptidase [Candidatus Acidiferrales bacterium]